MSDIVYRTLIADDESPARQRLRSILESFPEIEIIGESSDGQSAVNQINDFHPDLLFLDIQMPLLNGFEVLKEVNYFPLVIFCTAYDEYALKAFETNAIDYIVKPVREERIKSSLEKLEKLKFPASNKEQILDFIDGYLKNSQKKKATNIPIKIGDRMLLLKLADISYFLAEEKYVTIFTVHGKKHITDYSLKYLEGKLDESFIRIHRSILINLAHIHELKKYFGGRFIILMDDNLQSRLISGRSYSENIRKLFDL